MTGTVRRWPLVPVAARPPGMPVQCHRPDTGEFPRYPGAAVLVSPCVMTFPGRPESARAARQWAKRCLAGCPSADEVMLAVTELVTNSVRHSRSGLRPGGMIRVRLSAAAGAWVRIEVRDDGPAATAAAAPDPGGLSEYGRGLQMVRALAGGETGADGRGLHWARLPWVPADAAGGEAR